MNISFTVTGGAQARDQIAALAARARDLHPAFLRGGLVVTTAAQQRIRDDGPGWAPQAFDVGRGTLLQRTGALFRSLTVGAEGNIEQDIPSGIRVGTNLRTPDGKYSIGVLMQDGTGIYGPRHEPIKPATGKALMIVLADGSILFRRSVKGSPTRPFLFIDDKVARKVVSEFAAYLQSGEA